MVPPKTESSHWWVFDAWPINKQVDWHMVSIRMDRVGSTVGPLVLRTRTITEACNIRALKVEKAKYDVYRS